MSASEFPTALGRGGNFQMSLSRPRGLGPLGPQPSRLGDLSKPRKGVIKMGELCECFTKALSEASAERDEPRSDSLSVSRSLLGWPPEAVLRWLRRI